MCSCVNIKYRFLLDFFKFPTNHFNVASTLGL